jgi:nucleotide-binding universal stress UspA family protein
MYQHLLVPTDGSKLSDKAVKHAISLAGALQARITAFYVAPPYPVPYYPEGVVVETMSNKDYQKAVAEQATRILSRVEKLAAAQQIACASGHVIADAPWEAILAAARKYRCDAIVMASHGRRGLAGLILGSETQKVLTHSKLPVVVVR